MNAVPARPVRGAGTEWPNPRAGGFTVEPAHWWRTATWWEPPTSSREVLGAGGTTFDLTRLEIMHRRAGRHLPGRTRRDPRRISMDKRRREREDLWPAVARPEIIGESLGRVVLAIWTRNCQPEPKGGKGLWLQH